jgi:alpha-tubulin suppressor-like RCC1 family protein
MAESMLLGVLGKDFGDGVFKYLAPRTLARLETTFTSELVFVQPGGAQALLLSVAQRRYAEAAEAGATLEVLGEEQGGRVTWATELLWIYMAMGRARVGGAKKMTSAGTYHSLVTSGSETWSFGWGGFGMLGHRGAENEAVPRLIEALNRVTVKQVAAGLVHSMVLTSEGGVWTWGDGHDGRLGHGNEIQQNVPKRVRRLTNVTDIAAGGRHSLAVGEGGVVYIWGNNRYGQLGLGDQGGGTHPIKRTYAKRSHIRQRLVPTFVNGVDGVVAVAAGRGYSLALSRDGTVMACGENGEGQLGLGDTAQRNTFTVVAGLRGVVDIDAGGGHSIAVTCEGEVWTWGRGHGGDDEETQWLVPTKMTGGGIEEAVVVQVAAGDNHSMALTATGGLYSGGEGSSGQLGHGDKENLAVPRVVGGIGGAVVGMAGGDHHSLVTTAEGRVLVFGSGASGLGLGAGVEEALTPTAIDGITMGEGEGKEG